MINWQNIQSGMESQFAMDSKADARRVGRWSDVFVRWRWLLKFQKFHHFWWGKKEKPYGVPFTLGAWTHVSRIFFQNKTGLPRFNVCYKNLFSFALTAFVLPNAVRRNPRMNTDPTTSCALLGTVVAPASYKVCHQTWDGKPFFFFNLWTMRYRHVNVHLFLSHTIKYDAPWNLWMRRVAEIKCRWSQIQQTSSGEDSTTLHCLKILLQTKMG